MLNTAELAGHVKDADSFHLPQALGGHIHLPEILGIQVTKFMVLELAVSLYRPYLFSFLKMTCIS